MSNILKLVADYYQTTLHGPDKKAIKILKDHGVTSKDALDLFQLGYSCMDLKNIATRENTRELIDAGLLMMNNRSYFSNSIVVPLYDREGQLVNFYNQRLTNSGINKLLYEDVDGFSNSACLKSCDEIIVTDGLFLALQLYQAGFKNVLFMPRIESGGLLTGKRFIVVRHANPVELAEKLAGGEIYFTTYSPKIKSFDDVFARKQRFIPKPTSKPASPILDKVVEDLNELGYVGEASNKKLAYLVAISRKLARPLSAIIISSSGAGKTGLMRAISELVPPEDRLMLSRLTPQALFHMPKDALMEKLIVVDERNGSSMADYSIRTMQTSNVLTMAKPKTKDEDSGIVSISVKSAYMESTTSDDINPENASRCFLLHLDESPEATKAILEWQRRTRLRTAYADKKVITDWHHRFQRSLQSLPVILPYVEHIQFPYHQVAFRRQQEMFLSLIEAVALVNQQERTIQDGVIYADVEDYKTAYELFTGIFNEQQKELSRNAQAMMKILEDDSCLQFTVRQAISLTGWSFSRVYRTIRELLQYEYIKPDHDKHGGAVKTYSLLDYSIYGRTNGQLTHPDELLRISSHFSKDREKKEKPIIPGQLTGKRDECSTIQGVP